MPYVAPSRIGKYDVEERVGEGAMGVVYRALDPVLKRRVAIKVMSEAFAQNDDLRERFLREAQAAGSLQHPNVITIYDFGEVDGHLYIAMEFVEGQDVAELLAHGVPLTTVHKLDIAIGVLQGLAFAHRRGIVHRDIKPANIRVDGEGHARIMDFGVAHLQSSDMTRSGVMLGTPSYMAPEQIVGGEVGPRTDIFSVGAVLYELLSGARPFAGGPLQAVMYRVLSEDPPPLEAVAPGLPPRLGEIILRALAKEPAKRYASAVDMANDLLAVRLMLDEATTASDTVSLRATIESALDMRRTNEFQQARRRRVVWSTVGVAAAAALVFTGWLLARRSAPRLPGIARQAAQTPRPAVSTPIPTPTPTAAPTLAGTPEDAPRKQPSAGPAESHASSRATNPIATNPIQKPPRTQSVAESVHVTPPGREPRDPAPPSVVSAPPATPVTTSSTPAPVVKDTHLAPAPLPNVTPPSNPAADIGAIVDAYSRAIESRDMAELRRIYPTITGPQASAFSDFFASTRDLRAVLSPRNIQVEGARATARVSGTYDFTTTTGRSEHQAVSFDVEFRRDAGVWKLVVVR